MADPQSSEVELDKSAATVLIEILAGILFVLNILAPSLAAHSSAEYLGAMLARVVMGEAG